MTLATPSLLPRGDHILAAYQGRDLVCPSWRWYRSTSPGRSVHSREITSAWLRATRRNAKGVTVSQVFTHLFNLDDLVTLGKRDLVILGSLVTA
jgi:hypothetical protein